MSERDDAKLDHLLADGRAAGPTLDRVWARLDTSLSAAEAARPDKVPFWRRPFVALGASMGVAFAALALVIVVEPVEQAREPFAPRGGADVQSAPLVSSSCGARDRPCLVGEEIALSITDTSRRLTIAISLDDSEGERVIAPAIDVTGAMARVLPLVIVPDPSDVAHGLTVRWRVLNDDGSTSSSTVSGSIHLHVEQP